jgi:hypothetical protein
MASVAQLATELKSSFCAVWHVMEHWKPETGGAVVVEPVADPRVGSPAARREAG